MRTTHERRGRRRVITSFTAAAATALAVSGAGVITASTAHADPLAPDACTASFSADHLYDGDAPVTFSTTVGTDYWATGSTFAIIADGEVMTSQGTGAWESYDFDHASALTWAGAGAATMTIRVYRPEQPAWTADINTPANCEATIRLKPIAPANLAFDAVANHNLGDDPVVITTRTDSNAVTTVESATPTVCTYADGAATLLAEGTCTLEASQSANAGYEADSVSTSFEVLPAPVQPPTQDPTTMRLAGPKGLPLSARTGTVRFTSTSPASHHLASLSTTVCTLSGTTVHLQRAGTCVIRATQVADTTHAAPVASKVSFPVWATPVIPKVGRTTQVVKVLGVGESSLRVHASGACVASGGRVALIRTGSCSVVVTRAGTTVRRGAIAVSFADPAQHGFTALTRAATVTFAFNSATLSTTAKRTLRSAAPALRAAKVIAVYGHTDGPGGNSAASLRLSKQRATAVASYLRSLGVTVKVGTVAVAHHSPTSSSAAKNRRADVYYLR